MSFWFQMSSWKVRTRASVGRTGTRPLVRPSSETEVSSHPELRSVGRKAKGRLGNLRDGV